MNMWPIAPWSALYLQVNNLKRRDGLYNGAYMYLEAKDETKLDPGYLKKSHSFLKMVNSNLVKHNLIKHDPKNIT